MAGVWQMFVDTGGTFTDCLGVSPDGQLLRAKVLSNGALRAEVAEVIEKGRIFRLSNPWSLPDDFFVGFRFRHTGVKDAWEVVSYDSKSQAIRIDGKHAVFNVGDLVELDSGEEPPVLGARVITKTPHNCDLPPMALRLGTTRGTNALLERKGSRVGFFVTHGFGDLIEIGNQQRPDLFTLDIVKPVPLYERVCEVAERLDACGHVIEPIEQNECSIRASARELLEVGIEVAAVVLMHSYLNPSHEETLKQWLLEEGFKHVVISSELSRFIKMLPRAQTTVVNGYLAPIMETYLNNVAHAMGEGSFHVMTSAGGLVPRQLYQPKDSLLSGPAGGVVGAKAIGEQVGCRAVIAFDMGGTSTDVARIEGDFDYQSEHRVGDAEIVAPSLKIETVAAGGGSICGYNGHALWVGPDSAGASPGPACYGAGGPLTISDVNLLLGRLNPAAFGIPVSVDAAEIQLAALMQSTQQSRETLLQGFLDIANERMADAIKQISVREGYDPAEYSMVAFGGAGAMHACAVSERLGIRSIVFPADAGLLSAYGLQQSALEHFESLQLLQPYSSVADKLNTTFQALEDKALEVFKADCELAVEIEVRKRTMDIRWLGQESTLCIEYDEGADIPKLFQQRYESIFGYCPQERELEVVRIQVIVSSVQANKVKELFTENEHPVEVLETIPMYAGGDWVDAPLILREVLSAGDWLDGPAVIADAFSGLVIEPGWRAVVGDAGTLMLNHQAHVEQTSAVERADVVQLELFTNRFRSIVEEMGLQLQRTALSTNVKERLDFSCALLDSGGRLIANAPHIPVHLGAIGLCVRTVAAAVEMGPGDVVITNHPGYGGSHLPDVTVITPVFNCDEVLLGYVANRAHHAEMGGMRPGSMPPEAKCLEEEGVVIAPMYLFRRGISCFDEVKELLAAGSYPSRAVEDNLADIRAQVAANRRGVEALMGWVHQCGQETVFTYMQALREFAAQAIGQVFSRWSEQSFQAKEYLDDGACIAVRIERANDRVCIDFMDTTKSHAGNLNATPAIVQSAVIYVLRLLVDEDIPLNDGLVEQVEIRLPRCFLNPDFSSGAKHAPAVVGGNVETSQRIVDTLIKALGAAGCSQGTMNNLVFGNEDLSYYETICGGAGATANNDGASAVHTHMTNTVITDPEILENRYPVRLQRFAVRRLSGGRGQFHGGDGIEREITFLAPLSVSLLTQHRREGPFGCQGGNSGKPGEQVLYRANGDVETLESVISFEVSDGDRLVIKTPGGGGYGEHA